ncbi:MAG: AAA family ATPase, partial [Burkholderiales bacterium]|nr:AAA family ATPase [Burkholderiales bacterium]
KKLSVDNTEFEYQLAQINNKDLLMLPRRFGKSLLISTFYSLFKHGLRDFKGLGIEKQWQDQSQYTVIRLDFSLVASFQDAQDFRSQFDSYLLANCLPEAALEQESCENRKDGIEEFRRWLKNQPRGSVVLLIDEYDVPLRASVNELEKFQLIQLILARFYSTLKINEGAFRFLFITGITGFSNAKIFTYLNNLWNITLLPKFGDIVGFTLEELKNYFSGYIAKTAPLLNISEEGLIKKLVANYNSFCFESSATKKVIAPWSILNFFASPRDGFINYWFTSAVTPTFLGQFIKDSAFWWPSVFDRERGISSAELSGLFPSSRINGLVLLEQIGCLTIKKSRGNVLTLSYPNLGVSYSMARLYLRHLLKESESLSLTEVLQMDFPLLLEREDISEFVRLIDTVFLSASPNNFPYNESNCMGLLLIVLKVSGVRAYQETHNAFGRSDIEFTLSDVHWTIVLKFARKGEDIDRYLSKVEKQMEDRLYEEQTQEKRYVQLVLVFSEEQRKLVKYAFLRADR